MGSIFLKTLIMFLLAFVISMFVALLIYWIRNLLTSVRLNSLFDEKSKILVKRAQRIHRIHDKSLKTISVGVEMEIHPELFDYHDGVNDNYQPVDDFYSTPKPIVRRKRTIKKHKNI